MRTGAVIAAAGMSSRMGDFKPMLKLGSISIAQRVVANFQQADVYPIVVVTGFRAQELEKHLSKLGVICIRNENYESTQMFDSAKLGFSYIRDKCDRFFFTPVDIPLFTLDTLNRLMSSEAKIAKPVFGGAAGHPMLMDCSVLPSITASTGERGLKQAVAECGCDIDFVSVQDEGVLMDVDTPADYRELIARHSRQLLRPTVDVSLMREGKLFDRNAAMLLHLVEGSGTVKDACERAGISYSKAWKMLSSIESNFGMALIQRQPGGESGGSSRLTDEGRELLKKYEQYTDEVKRFANEAFERYFSDEEV